MSYEDDQPFCFIYLTQSLDSKGCIQFADITSYDSTGFSETFKYSWERFFDEF